MNAPAFLDQYPANAVPFNFAKLYGPIPLTTARKYDPAGVPGAGFEKFAALVDLGAFLKPRNGNVFVNREGAFYWCATNIAAYYSFTHVRTPKPGSEL